MGDLPTFVGRHSDVFYYDASKNTVGKKVWSRNLQLGVPSMSFSRGDGRGGDARGAGAKGPAAGLPLSGHGGQ